MSRNRAARSAAFLAILALVAAACNSKAKEPTAQQTGRQGGNIIVASEQFPDCLNTIDTCSSSSWFHWVVGQMVLPKAMTLDKTNTFVASPLLTEAPTLQNGGLTEDPFTIHYKLNPAAVWEDGTPITWEDFQFTWQAVLKTKGSYSTLGYDKIKSIKKGDTDQDVIIAFSQVYADWQDVFGGSSTNGYVLKKGAFPKGTDVAGTMQDKISFSGGPWVLKTFKKDQQLVLVRNEKYWGDKKAIADRVTVIAREKQTTELKSLQTGDSYAIYPQPTGTGLADDLSGAGIKTEFGAGTTYEGFWINMEAFPMDTKEVRQAFAYAIDRQAIVDAVVKPDNPNAEVLNCAGWVPTVSDWCDPTDYAKYTYDAAKAKGMLEAAGWECGSTPCTKDGKKLIVEITTTEGNEGRKKAILITQQKAKAAGFDIQPHFEVSPSPIFTDFLPKRKHVVAIFANVASPDPSVTSFLHSGQIPDAEGAGGSNWSGWKNAEADKALDDSDKALDHNTRRDFLRTVGDLEAEELPWIPQFQKPLIAAWRSDKIGGPIADFTSSPLSIFYNINEWFLL